MFRQHDQLLRLPGRLVPRTFNFHKLSGQITRVFYTIMSISPVIDERYRLQTKDLGRARVQVTIQNVSWQGVERLQPLLHLREFPQKRLLLDQWQVQSLIEIVGSALAHDWIGHTIMIAVEHGVDEPVIVLRALKTDSAPPLQWRPPIHLSSQWRTLLLALVLALLFALVFLLDNSDAFWQLF